jgi:hypothetical protein
VQRSVFACDVCDVCCPCVCVCVCVTFAVVWSYTQPIAA